MAKMTYDEEYSEIKRYEKTTISNIYKTKKEN
jgi:hypothetical protein